MTLIWFLHLNIIVSTTNDQFFHLRYAICYLIRSESFQLLISKAILQTSLSLIPLARILWSFLFQHCYLLSALSLLLQITGRTEVKSSFLSFFPLLLLVQLYDETSASWISMLLIFVPTGQKSFCSLSLWHGTKTSTLLLTSKALSHTIITHTQDYSQIFQIY